MISRIKGVLLTNDLDRIEVETGGGVVYEIEVPLTILPRLPRLGQPVEIRTLQVVREDSAALYGFMEAQEREMFRRLLNASGVGPKLGLAMLSTLSAQRLARALVDRDLAALTQVSGVGKKKAEKLVLELADKMEDLALASTSGSASASGQAAVSALVALGYQFAEADEAVRKVLKSHAEAGTDELVRRALAARSGG